MVLRSPKHPHQGQPVLTAGAPLPQAKAALILLHGRGASAEDILSLAYEIDFPGLAYLAPQAAGSTWYPNRFLEPTSRNEPWLTSALRVIQDLIDHCGTSGLTPEWLVLLGFSQGGCLAMEFAARNARRYGGLAGLSAGVIGADGEPRHDRGNLDGTPVFMGCSVPDPHIPRERVEATARLLESLGGRVNMRFYPNLGHTINQDEIDFIRAMVEDLLQNASKASP